MHKKIIGILAVLAMAAFSGHADPRFASLKLTSVPDSCRVFLDGKLEGITPLELQAIEPGKHLLHVVRRGYRLYVRELAFEGGKRIVGKAVLDTLTTIEADSVKQEEMRRALKRADVPDTVLDDEIPNKHAYVAVDKNPVPLKMPQPVYPDEAKKNGIEGKVFIQMLIDTDGHVVRADVAKSSGDQSMDNAAVEAALQWTFSPATAPGNKPVRVWVMQSFTFRIN